MSKLCAGLLIVVALVTLPTKGTRAYYVSAGGDDCNSGTREQPWSSIEKVNAMRFGPGDAILFHGGDIFEGHLVLDRRSQTSAQRPITIGSYGGSRATIAAGTGTGILVKDLGGIVVRDLVVLGAGASRNWGTGVEIRNSGAVASKLEFVRVESVDASGFRWAGIYIGGPGKSSAATGAVAQSGFRDVRIEHSIAHHNLYYGIHVSGPFDMRASAYANKNVTVSDSVAHNNSGDPLYTANHSGSGILMENTDGGVIERCAAYENGGNNGSLAGGPVGIWAHNANQIVIQSCVSYQNRTKGSGDGGGFDFDGGVSNSTMQYNLSFDNDGPGYLVWNYRYAPRPLQHIVVRYNISSGDSRRHTYGGIHVGGEGLPLHDIALYHNTVVTDPACHGARAVWVGGPPHERVRFWNNLLVSTGATVLAEILTGQNDVVFQGNAYWTQRGPFAVLDHGSTFGSLELWRASNRQEMSGAQARGMYADPKVSDNFAAALSLPSPGPTGWYRPLPGSPLINAGIDISALFDVNVGMRDVRGTTVPQGRGRDIGAQQHDPLQGENSRLAPAQGAAAGSGKVVATGKGAPL